MIGASPSLRAACAPLLVLVGAGCSGDLLDPANPDAASTTTSGGYALVVLSHDHGEPGVAFSGQFVRYRGLDGHQALHAMALPEEAWLVEDAAPIGRCVAVESDEPLAVDGSEEATIDLLSAGTVAIHPPAPLQVPLTLQPRTFPQLNVAVAGVVYDADAPQELPYLATGAYRIEADGEEVGALRAVIEAPRAARLDTTEVTEDGLAVGWTGDEPAQLVLSRSVGARTLGVACGAEGGEALIPAEMLAALGPGRVQLTVSRTSRAPLEVAGLDEGHLVFVSRDATTVRLPREWARDPATENGSGR